MSNNIGQVKDCKKQRSSKKPVIVTLAAFCLARLQVDFDERRVQLMLLVVAEADRNSGSPTRNMSHS